MKLPELRTVRFVLLILLILAMCNEAAFEVRLGGVRVPVAAADVLLALALLALVAQAVRRGRSGLRLPPPAAFALAAAAALAVIPCATARLSAAKEAAQIIEYFLVGFLVFLSVEETGDVKALAGAFVAAVAIVVGWGAADYFRFGQVGPLDVKAGYANRNALGAFLAMAVPALYGMALHVRRWPARVGLLIVVGGGLVVNLSGGSLLACLAVMTFLSALRGPRTLLAHICVLGLVVLAAPRLLPRPYHTDTLASSLALEVDDNFLLGDAAMLGRAKELFRPTHKIAIDHSGEPVMPPPRPLDAERLLHLLNRRRPLTSGEMSLLVQIKAAIERDVSEEERINYPLQGPQSAVRYQRWNAALLALRKLWDSRQLAGMRGNPLTGYGLRPYHELVKPFMPRRLRYRTDEPEVFNVAAPEPMTHNAWLKTSAQMGLLGFLSLVWLLAALLGRAIRLHGAAHSELMLGLALGAVGGIVGFALAGLFTENIARGLALPLVFLCSLVPLAERIVHGEGKRPAREISRYD